MTEIYLIIVFALILCFIIKWTKIKSRLLLLFFKKLHRPIFLALVINIVLKQFNWSFIGSYTNQVLILLTVLSGIFTYVFLGNENREIGPPRYYKIFFRVCLIFTIIGAVPLIFPYGAGFIYQLAARNYKTYSLTNSYFLKTQQYGVNDCLDLSLCKRFFLIEREIPIYERTDNKYDCFNDLSEVSIFESTSKGIKARIICDYNTDTTFVHLSYENSKLEVTRHIWYGIKTYKIDFADLQYKLNYSVETP